VAPGVLTLGESPMELSGCQSVEGYAIAGLDKASKSLRNPEYLAEIVIDYLNYVFVYPR
jgi:hypothetical protein